MFTFAPPRASAIRARAPGLSWAGMQSTFVSPTSRPLRRRTARALAALSGTMRTMLYSKPPDASMASRFTFALASALVTSPSVPGRLGRMMESSVRVVMVISAIGLGVMCQRIGERAGNDGVEAERLGFLDEFRAIGTGVHPQFLTAFFSNVVEDLHANSGRQVKANAVERHGNFSNGLVAFQALDRFFLRVDRINVVAGPHMRMNGFVAEFALVSRRTDNGHGWFAHSRLNLPNMISSLVHSLSGFPPCLPTQFFQSPAHNRAARHAGPCSRSARPAESSSPDD